MNTLDELDQNTLKTKIEVESLASQKKCLEFFKIFQIKKTGIKLPSFSKDGIKSCVSKCFGNDFQLWKPLFVYLNSGNCTLKFTFVNYHL